MSIIYKIYVDLDGTTANFTKKVTEIYPDFVEGLTESNKKMEKMMWKSISKYQKNGKEFWYDLEPMDDFQELWDFLQPYNPEILTATGNTRFNAGQQKIKWVKKQMGDDIIVHIVEKSIHKAQFASPTSILIDDKMKALQPFIEAGGIGIRYTNAKNTIEELKKIPEIS